MTDHKPLVWIPYPIHDLAIARLGRKAEVVFGYGEAAVPFKDVAARVEGILIRTGKITAEQIASAPRLKIIARHGVGVDSVDVDAATAAGVVVTNTPNSNLVSVAEHAIALLLALRRKLVIADRANQLGRGAESRPQLIGHELQGSTLGLVGFGRIATALARVAIDGFGINVIAYDPVLGDDDIRQKGATPMSLKDLLAISDAVSLHVPLLPQTRHLIGENELRAMKKGAVIINTARGGIIDEEALLRSLEKSHLGGAALDVTETEPLPAGHPFYGRPDVIITPHIGGQTEESLLRVAMDAAECVCQALSGEIPTASVNAPEHSRLAA
ncbi:hydroxyacid dehydrogenase [Pseudarthrobacter sp. NamE5]|uniref:hydroxyacid dehydrogenase n=1 Tax=Pseudarthrobacter sp. NamE5 TaxID=2576839 RepID=UPI00110AFDB2|nr:hydroxyacid dehydrogenase [Pseudarthrobacter sp. NamE5]TLM88275.1 hydroxyacid dehydrogenase [Pseudarthrobacter sp. NamE5]